MRYNFFLFIKKRISILKAKKKVSLAELFYKLLKSRKNIARVQV